MPSKIRKRTSSLITRRGSLEIEKVGERVMRRLGRTDLPLRSSIHKRLQQLINRTKERAISLPAKASRTNVTIGAVAVFAGADRSEKTTAAMVLANELNRPLYRIELSGVVSQYIGETEKNLKRVFDKAGHAGAILFFDEADALFSKRTEVKDAHDRYTNRQRATILERMKRYAGLTILSISRMALSAAIETRCYWILKFPALASKRGKDAEPSEPFC